MMGLNGSCHNASNEGTAKSQVLHDQLGSVLTVHGCHAQTALWNLSALQPFSARSFSILELCCNFLSVGLWLR